MRKAHFKREKVVLVIVLAGISFSLSAQLNEDCSKVLDTEPYFVKHKVLPTDSLLLHDIEILKHCGNFDDIETELLKGPVLGALLKNEVNEGKPATYRTVINFVDNFKKTGQYQEFKAGILLYRSLEHKKVSLKDWDADQLLFVRMGFAAGDLDDFKAYITLPAHQQMTYKEAYLAYMKEMEALGTKN